MASQSRLPSRRLPGSGRARPMSMFISSSDLAKQKNDAGDGDSQEESSSGSRSTSRLSKRRSLLPQFSRKEEKEKIQAPPTEEEDEDDGGRSGSASEATSDRLAMPPPPKPSRPLSMIRAPGLGIPGRTASLRSHARKASKVDEVARSGDPAKAARPVSMIVKSDSGLQRAGSLRLQQSPPRRGVSNTATQANPTHARTRTGSSSAVAAPTQKRPSVSSIKAPSINTNVRTRSPSQPSPTSPTHVSARPGSKSQLPSSSRPNFNTYQQHYSPAKSTVPKPPVPSAKVSKPAPSAETDIPITFDIGREQLELLLLSLSHQSSSQVLESYETSAKQSLGRRHARLYKEFASIRAREQEHRRNANLATLETWCPEPALLAEHLQTLQRVVSDLTSLTDPGSRYGELTSSFERWMADAEPLLLLDPSSTHTQTPARVRRSTSSSSSSAFSSTDANLLPRGGPGQGRFIDGLPEAFRATRTALALKLRAIQHDLSILPPCPPPSDTENPSSLEILVRNCSSLADGMLRELDVMSKLEKEVLSRAKARVNEQVDVLLARHDGSAHGAAATTATGDKWIPAWQSVA